MDERSTCTRGGRDCTRTAHQASASYPACKPLPLSTAVFIKPVAKRSEAEGAKRRSREQGVLRAHENDEGGFHRRFASDGRALELRSASCIAAAVRCRVDRPVGGDTGGPLQKVLLGGRTRRVTMIVPWPWARPAVETWDSSARGTAWWQTIRRAAARFAAFLRAAPAGGLVLERFHP